MKRKLLYLFNMSIMKIDSGYLKANLFSFVMALFIASTSMVQAATGAEFLNSDETNNTTVSSENEFTEPTVVNTFKITDGNTSNKSCFPNNGWGQGVIFQKKSGWTSYRIWKAGADLVLKEYNNNTAKITGTVTRNGTIGIVDISLSDKRMNGNSWQAHCYQQGISGSEVFYRDIDGTITVDGDSYTVKNNTYDNHYILADGASFEAGQFGLGAWTSGSFGDKNEWFGDLTLIDTPAECTLTVDAGEDVSNCNNTAVTLTATAANVSTCSQITSSYSIVDSQTEASCFYSSTPGVIFQKYDDCNGIDSVWRAGSDLILNEYADNTAKITGTLIDQNGRVGNLSVNLFDKEYSGSTWNASCYLDGISGPETFYRSFSGALTVNGVPMNVGTRGGAHFILAQGAGFDNNQYGLGAWTGGGLGNCTEWFGNLVPRTITNPSSGVEYLWSTGETTQTISVTASGEYTVKVTDCAGCTATDIVKVNIGEAYTNIGPDQNICKGDDITLTADGEGSFLWSTGATTSSITVSPTTDAVYSVTVTNGHCTATDTVKVNVGEATADAGADQNICKGEEVTLTVQGEGTYRWSTNETTQSITVNPTIMTEYSVTVTNGHCVATDTVTVTVDDKVMIGDFVWLDENENGLQDDGATGINGVTVTLFHCNGDEVATTTTADNGSGDAGAYNFEVCPNSGDYYIVFGDEPDGFEFTASNAGDDVMDSDADANGRTSCFGINETDDLTIDAGFTEICDLTVDAGEEVNICLGETIEITAQIIDDTEECTGGCVYPILDQDRCYGPTGNFEIYLVSTGSVENFKFKASEQKFERLADGSARYTATATNGNDIIEVDVMFTGYTTTTPLGSPKANMCQDYDTSDWEYWTTWSGTITSQNHGVFNVRVKEAAFQMGVGADMTRTGLGASGWFSVDGGDGHYTTGDVNITVEECIEEGVVYTWSTEDGNIVGDANQKSIYVNRPGTYTVEAVNCIDCVDTDTIVVTMSTCSIVAKAGNKPKMMTIYPIPVRAGGVLTVEFDIKDDSLKSSELKATGLKATVDFPQRKEDVKVMLYDMTGRMISVPRTFKIVDGKAIIYLDLNYMSAGKYILRAQGSTWFDSKSIIVK